MKFKKKKEKWYGKWFIVSEFSGVGCFWIKARESNLMQENFLNISTMAQCACITFGDDCTTVVICLIWTNAIVDSWKILVYLLKPMLANQYFSFRSETKLSCKFTFTFALYSFIVQLYCFEDRGNRRVALRPELTPSLARFVIQKYFSKFN